MLSQECGKQRVAGELRIDAIYDEHVIGGFEGDADRWHGGRSGLARTVEALLYSVCHPVDVHRKCEVVWTTAQCLPLKVDLLEQIGRAACRERVCQYV